MKVYWREHRTGERLILDSDTGKQEEVGSVRLVRSDQTYAALAKTMGYEPGRAQKGFPTLEDAKAFVEAFHPWDIFVGSAEVEFDKTVHPMPEAS